MPEWLANTLSSIAKHVQESSNIDRDAELEDTKVDGGECRQTDDCHHQRYIYHLRRRSTKAHVPDTGVLNITGRMAELDNLFSEADIDIIGVQESRLPQTQILQTRDYTVFNSGASPRPARLDYICASSELLAATRWAGVRKDIDVRVGSAEDH